ITEGKWIDNINVFVRAVNKLNADREAVMLLDSKRRLVALFDPGQKDTFTKEELKERRLAVAMQISADTTEKLREPESKDVQKRLAERIKHFTRELGQLNQVLEAKAQATEPTDGKQAAQLFLTSPEKFVQYVRKKEPPISVARDIGKSARAE